MDFLRKHVFQNFSLKVLALASAFLLWNAVAREPVAEVAHNVPIEFERVPAGMLIEALTTPQAQIWIQGPQRLVRQVNPGDLHVMIDLGRVNLEGGGERTFSLPSPRQIHAPVGVEVVQVNPAEIRLRLTPVAPPQPSSQSTPGETR